MVTTPLDTPKSDTPETQSIIEWFNRAAISQVGRINQMVEHAKNMERQRNALMELCVEIREEQKEQANSTIGHFNLTEHGIVQISSKLWTKLCEATKGK